jgi:hypothetical protein
MATAAFDDDVVEGIIDVQQISLEDYLQSVMNAVEPSCRMWVTEQHRKKMIRCLMGYTNKNEFDLKLQNLHLRGQWEKTTRFVEQDLSSLQVDETKAPSYTVGIQRVQQTGSDPQFAFQAITEHSQTMQAGPSRFFSFLARGRAYKGRLDSLLEDIAPHLIPKYLDIVQEPSEIDLMRKMVLEETDTPQTKYAAANLPPAIQWKDQLLQLLEKDFDSRGPQQPDDGGKQMGIRGELDLTSYLQQEHAQDANTLILSNVYVKPPSKHFRNTNQQNSHKRKMPHVILSDIKLVGMTSEFDALAVHMNATSKSIQVTELWEAKATLSPITISDVLFKKVHALEQVLKDPKARIHFCFEDETTATVRQVMGEDQQQEPLVFPFSNSSANTTNPLRIGIFGMDLLDPRSAARRTQFVKCEQRLERSPQAVVEALERGHVTPPDVIPSLERLLEEARRLQPLLVIPASNTLREWK